MGEAVIGMMRHLPSIALGTLLISALHLGCSETPDDTTLSMGKLATMAADAPSV